MSRVSREGSEKAVSHRAAPWSRKFFAMVDAQRRRDGSPRYPIINKGEGKAFIARYRQAVEELYAMRQSEHRLTPHCSICEESERELIAASKALGGMPSEEDADEELCKTTIVRYEAAGAAIHELRRNGHSLDVHCDLCREAQDRVRELMNEGMLGFRCLVASCVRGTRARTANRPDLLIEGLFGVLDALVRFHPDYPEGSPIPLLRFHETGLELWTTFQKEREEISEAKRDVDFPSYAYHWVRYRVHRSLANVYYAYPFRFPPYYHYRYRKILRLRGAWPGMCESTGEMLRRVCAADPTVKERDVWDVLTGFGSAESLDGPREPFMEGARPKARTLFDAGTFKDAETAVYRAELFRVAHGWVRYFIENHERYTPVERAILGYRFGFVSESKETLAEVGARVSRSRERIRQAEDAMAARLGLTTSDLWAIRMIYDAFHEEFCPETPRLVPYMGIFGDGRRVPFQEPMTRILDGADHWCAMLAWAKSGNVHIVGSDLGAGQRSVEEVRQTVALVSSPEALIRCLLKEAVIDEGGRALVWYPERILEERQGLYPKEIEFVLSDLKSRGLIRFLTGMIPIIAISKPFNMLTGSR